MKDEGWNYTEARGKMSIVGRREGDARDLQVRTKNFALRVIRMFAALPKSIEAQVLGKQVLRSGTSVGANFREANRSRSDAEFLAKIGDCLKELDETGYWFELLAESSIVSAKKLSLLQDECGQLLAIFTAISKKTKAKLGKAHP